MRLHLHDNVRVDRYLGADAAFVARLAAELGGARITSSASWFEPRDGIGDDDLGALVFAADDIRIELQLWNSVLGLLDTWLARRDEPVHGAPFTHHALDPSRVHHERPTEPVVRFVRELVDVWAVAAGHALAIAPSWRSFDTPRMTVAGWRGRQLAFDAHLSQLMSEPLGALVLLTR
jgi:hypothetical protein